MNFKRIIVFVIVLGMMVGTFSFNGTPGNVKGAGRHHIITVNNITVVHNQNDVVDGIYRNGYFRLNVSFGLADAVGSVNVTWNITHVDSGSSEVDTVQIGNLNAGNHFSVNAHQFNFSVVGNYSINATVWGSYNNSNISTSLTETFHFENHASYELNFEVDPWIPTAETGEYNVRGLPMTGSITNTGNYAISQTKVSINITGDSGSIGMVNPESRELGYLPVGEDHDNIQFIWSPEREGNYTVNITAYDNMSGGYNFTTFDVKVFNVSYIKIWDIQFDPEVDVNTEFSVGVLLTNTGNYAGNTTVTLNILDAQDNVAYTNVSVTEDIMATGGGSSLHYITNISIETEGLYTVNVSVPVDSSLEKSIIIRPNGGEPPQLYNAVMVPDPRDTDVNAPEIVTFYVIYSDVNNNPGLVKLDIDGEKFNMTPSDGIGNSWVDGEQFEHEWTSTVGNHNFSFVCTDGMFNVTFEPPENDFTILDICYTNGTVKGKVTDEYGNVSGVKIDIYQAEVNETGVATGNRINEMYVETDENGSYLTFLDFSESNYIITVNEAWMEANNYIDVIPVIDSFRINEENMKVWKNFTLVKVHGDPLPKYLNGTVIDILNNPLPGVTITVEIFRDEPGNLTIQKEINGTLENITVDITTRTWMNMTTTTDANGAYSIRGVPFDIPKITDVTGRKIFRHDLDGSPNTVPIGWWNVIVNKSGCMNVQQLMQFKKGETTIGNFTLFPGRTPPASIFGFVDPPDASIHTNPERVIVHNMTTGEFTIPYLVPGTYQLTFQAPGYYEMIKIIEIVNHSSYNAGNIQLDILPLLYDITIGPFVDENGDAMSGITVSFTLSGVSYSNVTGADGMAEFAINNFIQIPDGTEIALRKGDKTYTIRWPGDGSWGVNEDDDEDDGSNNDTAKGSNLTMILTSIGIIVLILVAGIVVWISIFRKKTPDIPEETSSCDHACPYCAAPVPPRVTYCPICGEEFNCTECGYPMALGALRCGGCGKVPE